jgi:hypothetical protein
MTHSKTRPASSVRLRNAGALALAVTVGSVALLGPAATANAAPASTATVTSAATSAPTGERNTTVSRSMSGIRSSAYIGKYYSARHEGTRKCIVRKESHGNYRIASRTGKYRGAYQFNAHLARATAKRMGRPDLAGKNFNHWSRFEQDKAFWTVWNHGKGRGNWPTARGC